MVETTMDKMMEEQKTEFNSWDYNNMKNFLGFVIDKFREGPRVSGISQACNSCGYDLCLLCKTEGEDAMGHFNQLTAEGMKSDFKL